MQKKLCLLAVLLATTPTLSACFKRADSPSKADSLSKTDTISKDAALACVDQVNKDEAAGILTEDEAIDEANKCERH